jgi:predicted MPP superfamily phosphohydrolase
MPDFLHPQLLAATLGGLIGLLMLIAAYALLLKRWNRIGRNARWAMLAVLALLETAYWLNIYAWFVEPNLLVIRHVEIVTENWRGDPLTIAVLSDTHVGGPHVDAARMGRIVARINTLRPELVVLLGDYVSGHAPASQRSPAENQEIIGGIATFAALRPRYGVVAVIGNHDVWYDREAVTTALQNAGVAALWNRHIVIPRSGGAMVLAGIADDVTGDPDFSAALDGAPANLDTIILSHSPDPFARMASGPALMLAGHGHCGQVAIPFWGRPNLPLRNRNYDCGLIEEGGEKMYVTAGIGTSIVPLRFLNPPEIVLITLLGTGR